MKLLKKAFFVVWYLGWTVFLLQFGAVLFLTPGGGLSDLAVWGMVFVVAAVASVLLHLVIGRGVFWPVEPDGYTKVDIPGGHLYVRDDQQVERHDGFVRITNKEEPYPGPAFAATAGPFFPESTVNQYSSTITHNESTVTHCDGGSC